MSYPLRFQAFLLGTFLTTIFFFGVPHVHAATLSVSAPQTVTTGDVVRARIVVNAGSDAINTAEAVLQFPSDVLDVISVDKSSSIFSIWVDEPSFSNAQGTVSFSGGLPSPGYSGSAGTVLSVTFHAKRAGTASLSLSGATVRANDGLGTNVLRSVNGTTLQVTDPVKTPTPPTPTTVPTTQPTDTKGTPKKQGDTTAPTISASSFKYDVARGILTISATAKDADSGIEGYDVQIDTGANTHIPASSFVKGVYEMPVHESGTHTSTLQVIDNAGNRAQVTGSFVVPSIPAPTLTDVPERLTKGDQLVLHGSSAPEDAQVRLSISKNGAPAQLFTVTPDTEGHFDFIGPVTQNGVYTVWAEGISVGGIVSGPTARHDITVTEEALFTVGGFGVTFPLLLAVMLFLTLASCLAAGLAWYRLYTYHSRRGHLSPSAGKNIHRALNIFRDEMETHLDALEATTSKRELTKEEMSLRAEMRANLVVLEKYIQKELD